MYYYENQRLYRYYASFNNVLFRTREEYLAWVGQNNLQLNKISYFRLAKNARKNAEYPIGKWIEYEVVLGTTLFDERDLSEYVFRSETEAEEFLKTYRFDPDIYDTCPFEGYDEQTEKSNELDVVIEPFDVAKENKTYAHFIMSYMPDNTVKRSKRYEAHLKQIANIMKITPDTKIFIVAQNYADNEYINDSRIEYKKFATGIGAGRARNECLKWLYQSDYEYGIISDDDALLAVTQTAINFFEEFKTIPQKFINAGIDVCYPRNMHNRPWNMSDIQKANFRSANWEFCWAPSGWFHWTMFRNLKKAYNREMYQSEDINSALGQGYDDMDFSYALIDSGIKCYFECTIQLNSQLIQEQFSVVQSTLDANYRVKSLNATRSKFLRRTDKGGWDYDEFRIRNSHQGCISVPKEEETNVWSEMSGGRTQEMKEDFILRKTDINPV